MKKTSTALLFLLALLAARGAAPADLGQGLGYLRVHALGEDGPALTAALARNSALVLDLRHPSRGPESLEPLRQALARHPSNQSLFVLVGPDTPAEVAALLAGGPAGSLVLGATGTGLPPLRGIEVEQSAEEDRLAYAAGESGLSPALLISGKVDKERYDEAALMTDFRGGPTDPPAPPAANPAPPKAAAGPPPKPTPTDRVLQRAVHLHRALLALSPQH